MRRLFLAALACLAAIIALAMGGIYWFLSGDGIRTALESQATTWLGQPVHIASARVEFLPRIAIRLEGVSVGEPARLTLAEVAVSTALRALLGRRIAEAEVRIRDSRLDLPLPFALPSSAAPESEADAGAGGAPAFVVESIRSIALQDVTIASRGQEIRVSADSSLAGTSMQLQQFTAESGKTSISVQGAIELEPRVDAALELTANRIDLDELLALAEAFSGSVPAGSPANRQAASAQQPRIRAQVTSAAGTIGGVEVSQVVGDFEVEGDQVVLSPLTFQVFGGRFEGSFNATLEERMAVHDPAAPRRTGTREGNRVVLPATLGGTLEEPRLAIDAAAALRRGLQNEIGERLKGLFGR